MQLHDTHFHLDLFQVPQTILEEIERQQIYTIAVTNLPALFAHTLNLVSQYKFVRAALGFHPELIASRCTQLEQFKRLITHSRYIGEVGLDNLYKSPSDYSEQKKVFESIIQACDDEGNKILTVHSRRAEKEVISMIGPSFKGKVILHWYSGSTKEMERALQYGFYFSVNAAMLQSPNGQKIISRIPNDRILLETDGPYIEFNGAPCSPKTVSAIANNIIEFKKTINATPFNQSDFHENFSALLSSY